MAKLYYAKAYVAVGDSIFRPGEVFDPNVSKEELGRLLKMGAIAECENPLQLRDDTNTQSNDTGGEDGADDQMDGNGSEENGNDQVDGNGSEENGNDQVGSNDSEEEEESAPAEIDAMDGVSSPKDSQAKSKTSRKSSKRGGDTK